MVNLNWLKPHKLVLIGCDAYEEGELEPTIQAWGLTEHFFTEQGLVKRLKEYQDKNKVLKIGKVEGKNHYVLRNPFGDWYEPGWRIEIPESAKDYFPNNGGLNLL